MWAYRVCAELVGGRTIVLSEGETDDPVRRCVEIGIDDVFRTDDLREGEEGVLYLWINGWLPTLGDPPEDFSGWIAVQFEG